MIIIDTQYKKSERRQENTINIKEKGNQRKTIKILFTLLKTYILKLKIILNNFNSFFYAIIYNYIRVK